MARIFDADMLTQHTKAWATLTEMRAANMLGGVGGGGDFPLVSSALPAADLAHEGYMWYVAGSAGTPGALYFCAQTSVGDYEWIFVGFTSV